MRGVLATQEGCLLSMIVYSPIPTASQQLYLLHFLFTKQPLQNFIQNANTVKYIIISVSNILSRYSNLIYPMVYTHTHIYIYLRLHSIELPFYVHTYTET